METTITKRRYGWHVLLIAAGMLLSILIPSTAQANTYSTSSGSPCPQWSVDDVLADLNGDWDGDRLSNSDEVFVSNGLNPCVNDSAAFCSTSPSYCTDVLWSDVEYYLVYNPTRTCVSGYWTWDAVNTFPHNDWDGDGVTNHTEAINGANPCVAPCPTAYNIDVALNPWGDWDGDGRSNQSEVQNWTNPCVYNTPLRLRHVTTYVVPRTYTQPQQTQRLPHVGAPTTTYVAPAPTVSPCPAGYPYFHKANGQCYANPINTPAGW